VIPLLWPLVALVAGILAAPLLDPNSVWICLPLAILLAFVRRWGLFLSFALVGAGLTSLHSEIQPDPGDVAVRLIGTLSKPPEWRGPGVYLDIRLLAIDTLPYRGRVRLTEFLEDPELRAMFEALDLGSGDRLEIVVKLHRPAVYRDPGVPDFRLHLERQQIYWTGTIRNPRLITVLHRGWHRPDWIKNWITRKLETPFADDPEVQGVVMAMVLGRNYGLGARVEHQFQAAGIYHLAVVAGFHLAVVAGIAAWVARRLPLGRSARLSLVLVSVSGYVALTDGQIPVTRAAVMVGFLIAGKFLDRGYAVGNSIAGAAMVILLINPLSIEDSSFQMTFAAVIAVVGLGLPLVKWTLGWLREALTRFNDIELDGRLSPSVADWRVSRRLWCELYSLPTWVVTVPWRGILAFSEILLISLSVETVFVVFMVESFHRLSPISPLLNIPAGLAASAVIPLAFLTIVLPLPLGNVSAFLTTKLVHGILAMLDLALKLPDASLRVPSAPVWLWSVYVAGLGFLVWAIRARRVGAFIPSAVAVVFLQTGVALADFSPTTAKEPTITFIDVGQGDSMLVEFPGNKRALVDGGGVSAGRFLGLRDESTFSIGENVVSPFLWSKGIRKLDVVVLTHAHNDHLDGLLDVIENFKVGELWLGRNPMVGPYRELLRRALEKQIPIRWIVAGDVISMGSRTDEEFPKFTVLHPPARWRPKNNDQNNDSVVLLLDAGTATALLTGDIERTIPAPGRVDVYKVPHHGSKGVKLHVEAPIRVISVGENNPFGHPHPSTLPALRTDQLGAITVTLASPPVVVTALTKPRLWYKLTSLLEGH
jgi:competence protein ComEC